MMRKYLGFAALAAILVWSSAAHAYTINGSWSGTRVTMRASSVSFPVGNSYRTALGTVASRFNQNPSNFRFTQRYDDGSVSFNNGQNEVWFTDDADYDPAVTVWWTDFWTGHIDEADVVFYNGEAYTTSMTKTNLWPYGGSYRPFQTTALHEYGHVAGLGHENEEYNIMGTDWDHIHCNGSTARSYIGEDAADGLVDLYGLNSTSDIQDLSVSLFKYLGTSGEYSTHQKCKMYNTSGVELSSTSNNGQRRYNVSRGQRVRVEFTYENNGETTYTTNVGFYISTDRTISTSDTRFATSSPTLGRNDVYTRYYTLTIPSDLTSGTTYYLGAIVDYDGALSEITESNNAAYHIIRIN